MPNNTGPMDEQVERALRISTDANPHLGDDAPVFGLTVGALRKVSASVIDDGLREALEHFVEIIDGTEQTGFDPSVEQMLMDAAEECRPLLANQRSGSNG